MTIVLLLILLYLGIKVNKDPSSFIIIIAVSYVTLTLFQIVRNLYVVPLLSIVVVCWIIKKYKEDRDSFADFPFKVAFVLCFSSYMLSYIFHGEIRPTIVTNFLNDMKEYVFVVMAWMLTYNNANKKFFMSFLIIYMFILSIYGLNEALTGENVYTDYLQAKGDLGDDLYENDNIIRTGFHRTKSLTIWCESYGMICSISFFCILNFFLRKQLSISWSLGLLACLLVFGVYSTNSRTCLITMVIMLLSLLTYFKSNKAGISLVLSIIALGIYYSYDALSNVLELIVNINDSGGSSLDLRFYQLLSTLSFISNDFILGTGPGSVGVAMDSDADIYGAESVVFTTLITRGFFGLFTLIFLWTNILLFVIKKKEYWLLPLVIGFYFLKTATLLYGVGESYILLFVFLLMRFSNLDPDNQEVENQETDDDSSQDVEYESSLV